VDDQSRVKSTRNPIVEIVKANREAEQTAAAIRELCLRNSIDVLAELSDPSPLSPDEVRALTAEKSSDFIIYVDVATLTLFPYELPVTQHNLFNIIHAKWALLTCNLSTDQLELMSSGELEEVITRLTMLEAISTTVCDLQNETLAMLASLSLTGCRAQPQQMAQLRQKLTGFFGKLNLAHSVVADLPLYEPARVVEGRIVDDTQPMPGGLSLATQRMLSYIIGQHLTQIHMCLSHVNKMMGEFNCTPVAGFALAVASSPSLHPTPLCPPDAASICSEEGPRARQDGRRGESEVALESRTPYALSFREGHGLDTDPFNQFRRGSS
jgi:hypothetical protein